MKGGYSTLTDEESLTLILAVIESQDTFFIKGLYNKVKTCANKLPIIGHANIFVPELKSMNTLMLEIVSVSIYTHAIDAIVNISNISVSITIHPDDNGEISNG